MIYQLMYVSEATRPFSERELNDLLTKARTFNVCQDITGCLLYGDNKFIQFIEGDKDKVTALYEKIEKDPRHENCYAYQPALSSSRMFDDWSMGYKAISGHYSVPQGYEDCRQWIYIEFVGTGQDQRKKDIFNFAFEKDLMASQVESR